MPSSKPTSEPGTPHLDDLSNHLVHSKQGLCTRLVLVVQGCTDSKWAPWVNPRMIETVFNHFHKVVCGIQSFLAAVGDGMLILAQDHTQPIMQPLSQQPKPE
jgi:hypothetical protein